jgi:hypothetical protein
MTSVIPARPPAIRLALASRAFEAGRPVAALARRHVPVTASARVISLVGLTGDNLLVGVSIGRPDRDEPDTYVVCHEPRDPFLALRFASKVGAMLRPIVEDALTVPPGSAIPLQLWVDGPRSAGALVHWSHRLRNPWLPEAVASIEDRRTEAQDTFAIVRGVLEAARIPGADVVVDVAGTLAGHLAFPLADGEETSPLHVLLACLDLDGGEPVIIALERAEAGFGVSVAADPDWDNKILVPALHRFKRRRRELARGSSRVVVEPAIVERAAAESGLDASIREALRFRHRAIAEGVRYLASIPALPMLDARRQRASGDVRAELDRGLRGDRAWADFPKLRPAVIDERRDQDLAVEAGIDAIRGDDRAFAFARATGEAMLARVRSVSPDGRVVELEVDQPFEPRTERGWWWLDDGHDAPITGVISDVSGSRVTWRVTAQMRRLANNPAILLSPTSIRLTSHGRPFGGWAYVGGDPSRGYTAPVAGTVVPFGSPVDFAALGD